jgi:hypothetical protein
MIDDSASFILFSWSHMIRINIPRFLTVCFCHVQTIWTMPFWSSCGVPGDRRHLSICQVLSQDDSNRDYEHLVLQRDELRSLLPRRILPTLCVCASTKRNHFFSLSSLGNLQTCLQSLLYACLATRNSSRTAERILIKYDVCGASAKIVDPFHFVQN